MSKHTPERLRAIYATHPMVMEAAAEIERLRAALREIERQGGAEDTLASIARRALEPKP